MNKYSYILLFIIIGLFSCDNDDDNFTEIINNECGEQVILSAGLYQTAVTLDLDIDNLTIIDDCLTVSYNAGGCDGETFEFKLIDSKILAFSNPPQKFLKLAFFKSEFCEALIHGDISFDITECRLSNTNEIILNINESNVLYEY